jgi:hypothetical protein
MVVQVQVVQSMAWNPNSIFSNFIYMNVDLRFLLTLLIIFPAIAGIYKFKRVDKSFHPFIIMIWLQVIIEVINYLCKKKVLPPLVHSININVYIILNFFLFLYFTYQHRYIKKNLLLSSLFVAFVIALLNIIFVQPITILFYLLCFVSVVMLLTAIDILSKQIMSVTNKTNNRFWLWFSSTTIVYNAQTLLIFSIYFFALFNTTGGKAVGNIQTFINAACHIFFCYIPAASTH